MNGSPLLESQQETHQYVVTTYKRIQMKIIQYEHEVEKKNVNEIM